MSNFFNVNYLNKNMLLDELSNRGYNVSDSFTKKFLMDVFDGFIWLPLKTNDNLKLRSVAPRKELIFNEVQCCINE